MLAPAAPHIAEELWSRRRRSRRATRGRRSIPSPGRRSTPRRSSTRPARSRSRSTARSATGSSSRTRDRPKPTLEAIVLAPAAGPRSCSPAGRRTGHPRRRSPGEHRRPGLIRPAGVRVRRRRSPCSPGPGGGPPSPGCRSWTCRTSVACPSASRRRRPSGRSRGAGAEPLRPAADDLPDDLLGQVGEGVVDRVADVTMAEADAVGARHELQDRSRVEGPVHLGRRPAGVGGRPS